MNVTCIIEQAGTHARKHYLFEHVGSDFGNRFRLRNATHGRFVVAFVGPRVVAHAVNGGAFLRVHCQQFVNEIDTLDADVGVGRRHV